MVEKNKILKIIKYVKSLNLNTSSKIIKVEKKVIVNYRKWKNKKSYCKLFKMGKIKKVIVNYRKWKKKSYCKLFKMGKIKKVIVNY